MNQSQVHPQVLDVSPRACHEQLSASHDAILIFLPLGTEFIKPLMAPPPVGGTAPAACLIAGVTQRCHHWRPGVSQAEDSATQVRRRAKITLHVRHGAVSSLLPPNSPRCSCLLNFAPACSSLLALKVSTEVERLFFFFHFFFVICGVF